MAEQGHYRRYADVDLKEDTLDLIRRADSIVREYEGRGFSLTLRQLYYQFVARALMPNSQKNYDRLGDIVSKGRMAGLISWTAIEDRTRNLMGLNTHASPGAAVRGMLENYRIDMWAYQHVRPEVWVEKRAMEDVLAVICNELRVDFFVSAGYNSNSSQWRAGRRFADYVSKGQRPMVFYLGDHDPSGINMGEVNERQLSTFAGVPIQVVRLALNMDQVRKYDPPPNPAKQTDSRYGEYVRRHGDESWELDALDPEVIRSVIEDAVLRVRDPGKWDEALAQEIEDRRVLEAMTEELE